MFALLNTSPAEQTVDVEFTDVFFDQVSKDVHVGCERTLIVFACVVGRGLPVPGVRGLRSLAEGRRGELGKERRHDPG